MLQIEMSRGTVRMETGEYALVPATVTPDPFSQALHFQNRCKFRRKCKHNIKRDTGLWRITLENEQNEEPLFPV